ncbi:MAG: hypothetical protein EOP04_13190, partial [Proteobacteria bacterium]
MRIHILTVICLFLGWSNQLSALSMKEGCPKILDASGITNIPSDQLFSQFKAITEDGMYSFESSGEISNFQIKKGPDSSTFKISVEEVKPSGSIPGRSFVLDCPVVKSWEAIALPSIEASKPLALADFEEKGTPGKQPVLIRSGVELVKLFPGRDDYFTTTIYWRISAKDNQPKWPQVILDSKTTFSSGELAEDESLPIVGIRLSTTERFGDIWYLLTEKIKSRFKTGDQELIKFEPNGYSNSDDRATLS